MNININNYQSFCVGTAPVNWKGDPENKLGFRKDTIVKYEFNTKDKKGNKVMDKLTREETQELVDSIIRQYGDNVIVQFSGDALDIMDVKKYKSGNEELDEIFARELEERNARFQEALKPAQKLHRIIPNIQTDAKLRESLKGMGEEMIDAAYAIIDTDFLPHDIGNMTEEERQDLISLGMEKAKYLAKDMGSQGAKFLEAMGTIAQYGMNGKADEHGKVTYDIKEGPMAGAPDGHICVSELMKRIDPEAYEKGMKMWMEALEKKDIALEFKYFRFLMDWTQWAYKEKKAEINEIKDEYISWKKNMQETELKKTYDSSLTDIESFMDSIIAQNKTINDAYLIKNLKAFGGILQGKNGK
ncbi:MAG: hypothetical protein K2O16_08290 [Lachnospiraceae bacterium]|nr:hypothetical protein [Lachnospiraceae bacterium]